MWIKAESKDKPSMIDESTSEVYVYVRKDIEEFEREEETFYSYLEQKIKKEDWSLYESILSNTSDISDVQDALIELAEMVVG